MQWAAEPGAGFTRGNVRPWLPIGDPALANVADQRSDPTSHAHLCRDLIALRRETPDLRGGTYTSLPSPDGVWAWRRGEGIVVAVNLSGADATIPTGRATIAIGTDRSRDGDAVKGDLSLGPWEGAVLRVARA
jgi:alpha-glucosidase